MHRSDEHEALGDGARPKEPWQAPEVRSLDAPEVEGGAYVFSPEGYHFATSQRGTTGS